MSKLGKNQKGISSIAIVITVIVVLALAGIVLIISKNKDEKSHRSREDRHETESVSKADENNSTVLDKLIEDKKEIPLVLLMTTTVDGEMQIPVFEECLVDWDYQWEDNPDYKGMFVPEKPEKYRSGITHKYNDEFPTQHTIAIKGKVTTLSRNGFDEKNESQLNEILSWGTTGLETIKLNSEDITKIASPNTRSFEKLKNCQEAFYYCLSLKKIPSDFFVNCPNLVSLQSAFAGCGSLKKVPENFIVNCPRLTNLSKMFEYCDKLEKVSENFIVDSPNINNVGEIFYNCVKLEEIPNGMFEGSTKVKSFNSSFFNCNSLKSIPEDLFDDCTNVNNFNETFYNCKKLTEIPENLFDNCDKVTSFNGTFKNCSSLITIPENLFDNCSNVESYHETFSGDNKLKGNCPELWKLKNDKGIIPNGSACFYCCSKLFNYDTIPSSWKSFV